MRISDWSSDVCSADLAPGCLGPDGIQARGFAMKLSLLGILAVHHFDPVLMPAAVSTTSGGDVLLVFSEHGRQSARKSVVSGKSVSVRVALGGRLSIKKTNTHKYNMVECFIIAT